ncbi:MAG: HAMP domain-containing protein, partial [Planctomycetes bacterium]|nr:HAMP domain-containing protein [Planctomycetota bacterium]
MRIKQKLQLLVIAPILATAVLVGTGYQRLGSIREDNRSLAEDRFGSLVESEIPALVDRHDSIALLLNGDRDAYQVLQAELQILQGAQGDELERLLDQSTANLAQVDERINKGAAGLLSNAGNLIEDFRGQFAAWKEIHQANLILAQTDLPLAQKGIAESLAAFETMRHTIDLMQEAQEKGIANAMDSLQIAKTETKAISDVSATKVASTMNAFLLTGILLALAMITGGALTCRSVLGPISHLVARFQDIASGTGDLSQRVEAHDRDELGALGAAFNTFLDKLEGLIGRIRSGTTEINSNTNELTSTSDSLATSSTLQAQHLSNILGSTNEVTEMTSENSRIVEDAANLFYRATQS